jgi:hypothetical protein
VELEANSTFFLGVPQGVLHQLHVFYGVAPAPRTPRWSSWSGAGKTGAEQSQTPPKSVAFAYYKH